MVTVNTPITGSGGLTLNTFNSGSAITLGSHSNSYTGTTTINGNVNLGTSEVITDTSPLYVALGGTLNQGTGQTETVASLAGAGTIDLGAFTSAGTLVASSAANTATTFSGTIKESAFAGGNFTKTGTGILYLTGSNNSYTGVTTVSAGTLAVTDLGASGSSSGIGASPSAAGNIVLNGGTLQYFGNGNMGQGATTDHLFSVGTSGGTLDASGLVPVSFTNTGSMGLSGTGTRTLTLTGSNNASNSLAAVIGNNGANATALTKSGIGTWLLTGANTYTGTTTVSSGTLQVNSINSTMTNAQPLGEATTAIAMASTTATATLEYTVAAAATLNRPITVTTGGSATIMDSGGALDPRRRPLQERGHPHPPERHVLRQRPDHRRGGQLRLEHRRLDRHPLQYFQHLQRSDQRVPTRGNAWENGVLNALPSTTTLTLGDLANTSENLRPQRLQPVRLHRPDRRRQRITHRHQRRLQRDQHAGHHRHEHLQRRDPGWQHRTHRPDQVHRWHAHARRHEHLHRTHDGQRRHRWHGRREQRHRHGQRHHFRRHVRSQRQDRHHRRVHLRRQRNFCGGTGGGTLTVSSVSITGTGNSLSSGTIAGNASQAASSAWAVNGTLTGTDSLAGGASLSGTGSISGGVVL